MTNSTQWRRGEVWLLLVCEENREAAKREGGNSGTCRAGRLRRCRRKHPVRDFPAQRAADNLQKKGRGENRDQAIDLLHKRAEGLDTEERSRGDVPILEVSRGTRARFRKRKRSQLVDNTKSQ